MGVRDIRALGVSAVSFLVLFVSEQTWALAAPNDPLTQWHHPNIDSAGAWARETNCNKVSAIFDTGVRYTHADLSANMISNSGRDYTFGAFGTTNLSDVQGHGTFVAGFMGAVGNNHAGVTGLCWGAQMRAMKVLADNGSGNFSWAASAIYAAAGLGIQVANHSYGANLASNPFGGNHWPQVMIDALEFAGIAGVINVFAAGNSGFNLDNLITAGGTSFSRQCVRSSRGRCTKTAAVRITNPDIPPTVPRNTILVAASQSDRSLASFSNYGGRTVHLSAPGHKVVSTTNTSNTSYGTMSGTSFAAPIVAGAITLLWSRNSSWPPEKVLQELFTRHAAQPVVSEIRNEWTIVGSTSSTQQVCTRFGTRNRRTGETPCKRWATQTVQTPQYGYADVTYTSMPQAGTTIYGELRLTDFQ